MATIRKKEKARHRIVLVDNNPIILNYFEQVYNNESYEILTFNSPLKALEAIEKTHAAIVISDQWMPEMEGTAFLEKAGQIIPDAVQIIITGYANSNTLIDALAREEIYDLIRKPIDIQELNLAIRNAMDRYLLSKENKRLVEEAQKQSAKLVKIQKALKTQLKKQSSKITMNEKQITKTLVDIRKMLGATINAIQMIVEIRDPFSAGHQKRVANLARAIATEMGLSADQVDAIRMAAVIHDLGKIYEPTEILNKPGRLTDMEYEMMKIHPKMGYELLKEIDFSLPVASIVLQHHERMDGSGYPQGISGEEILLESRVMAVADVVEAMSSRRPYREALGIDKALDEIQKNKGVLYDPKVADACLRLFHEKGFTFT